jgi:hypothetical protein
MPPVYASAGSHDVGASGPSQELVLTLIANWLSVFHNCSQRVFDHNAILVFNTSSFELAVAANAGDDLCHGKPS